MIKVENIETWGFRHAIRGMRNPLNSWAKSDTEFSYDDIEKHGVIKIGDNDLNLMRRLYKGGSEHRKYLRQIFVSMDITAPLYFNKQLDTYKVGTVTNSCSSMHKIHAKEFGLEDFSIEHLPTDRVDDPEKYKDGEFSGTAIDALVFTIQALNYYRDLFLETKDKAYWYAMIQLLPSSYEQKRTLTMNYENAVTIIKQRTGHKLDEWADFIEVLKNLPYLREIMGE